MRFYKRSKALLLYLFVVVCTFLFCTYIFREVTKTSKETGQKETLIACRPPRLTPFDESIRKVLENEERLLINCTDTFPLLFESTSDSKLITLKNIREVYEDLESCCYQNVSRGNSNLDPDPDNNFSVGDQCLPVSLDAGAELVIPSTDEFLLILCKFQDNKTVTNGNEPTKGQAADVDNYDDFGVVDMHFFVNEKPLVESRIAEYYAESQNNFEALEHEKVNVVVLGIDGVSHMNFLRTMPKSYSYLVNDLEAIEMHGFNKIGDNTLPNVAAMLTCLNKSSLESTCESTEGFFDNCPFIWKEYAANGYRTSFAEDASEIGAFNYLKGGFREPPTDYYFRPFALAAESLIGNHFQTNSNLCYGPRLTFEVLLEYMKKFAYAMGRSKRYFQFVWATSLTHDFLFDGAVGDDYLHAFLEWFHDGGYLNETVLILMSDHGIRWGDIQEYLQGQLEERLPFLYFVIPPRFQRKYGRALQNLKNNRFRLTTPFDLHETLHDLLRLTDLDDNQVLERHQILDDQTSSGIPPKAISLFLPIPFSRTCEMAGIEEHYCTCHQLVKVRKDEPEVGQALNYILDHINSMLFDHPQCEILTLESLKSAHVILSDSINSNNVNDSNGDVDDRKGYHLIFQTNPGEAVFAASVIKMNKKDTTADNTATSPSVNGSWKVSGGISRSNLYGDQSFCVDDTVLKLYCYCKNK